MAAVSPVRLAEVFVEVSDARVGELAQTIITGRLRPVDPGDATASRRAAPRARPRPR